ncbi:S24 family peptidase [Fulvimarina sp. MAC3]|uniref:S24 family peptidase n=1 Tax=Fulvimarina sp. MAC3 TaxID=3148887 RepID=UPI0031FCD1C0
MSSDQHPKTEVKTREKITGPTNTLVAVPRFVIQAAAGGGAVPALQEPNDSFYVARDWLYRFVPPNVQISMIEVVGDSMDPTIRDGDVLLIRHDRNTLQATIGNVIVLTLDDLLYVKRLQGSDQGDMLLTSDNEFYTPIRIPRREWDERVRIHGLAFWHGGPIRKR